MEIIKYDDEVLAIIDNFCNFEAGLNFYGTPQEFIQIGRFRYDKGKQLRNHIHTLRSRVSDKTQEIMLVFKGSCEVRTYTPKEKRLLSAKILEAGDFYISYRGGCGFTIIEDDTIMMEIKNGPYNVKSDDEDRELL